RGGRARLCPAFPEQPGSREPAREALHAAALILVLGVDDRGGVGLEHDDCLELDHDVALLLPQVTARLEQSIECAHWILAVLSLAERSHLGPARTAQAQ